MHFTLNLFLNIPETIFKSRNDCLNGFYISFFILDRTHRSSYLSRYLGLKNLGK